VDSRSASKYQGFGMFNQDSLAADELYDERLERLPPSEPSESLSKGFGDHICVPCSVGKKESSSQESVYNGRKTGVNGQLNGSIVQW
jgi:hypothetical protein